MLAYQDLPVRVFVALFDYDPVSMSPNPDAGEEELPFREGQILKVAPCLSLPLPFPPWRHHTHAWAKAHEVVASSGCVTLNRFTALGLGFLFGKLG